MFDTSEYKALEGVNKSSLRELYTDPYLYHKLHVQKDKVLIEKYLEKKSKYTLMGDLVDALLSDEKSLTNFCYVSKAGKIGDGMKDVVQFVFDKLRATITTTSVQVSEKLEDYKMFIEEAVAKVEYQANWKMETRVNKVVEQGSAYFSELFYSLSKTIISIESYMKAMTIKDVMMGDPITAQQCRVNENSFTQVALQGTYKGLKIKGLLDRMEFYTMGNNTIQPVDFKTARDPITFRESFRKYGYPKQGLFYSLLIKENYPDFTVLPFKFAIGYTEAYTTEYETEGTNYPRPSVYTMNKTDYDFAKNGGIDKYGQEYVGLYQELDFLIDCQEKNWDFTKIENPMLNNIIEA